MPLTSAAACGLAVLAASGLAGCGHSGAPRAALPPTPTVSSAPVRSAEPRPAESAAARAEATLRRLLVLRLPIHCGGHRGRYVALTFDDGPGPHTAAALRILRAARARATFFLVGKELGWWPRLPRQELALGSIGDHTWTHPYLPRLSRPALVRELASTQAAIRRLTGITVELFRPPYGASDARVNAAAHALGMLEVLWSVDSRDSEGAGWLEIAQRLARSVRPGSIVLLHENRGQTIRALRYRILPLLRARRLVPVTLWQLLAVDPPTDAQVKAGLAGC